jgi:hypothetical protein
MKVQYPNALPALRLKGKQMLPGQRRKRQANEHIIQNTKISSMAKKNPTVVILATDLYASKQCR